MNTVVTEIRNFYSLRELSDNLEEELSLCKAVNEEYGERLGSILRSNEPDHKDEEWFKALSGLQSSAKDSKSKDKGKDKGKSKGKGKGKKKGAKSGWIQFKDLMLSTENHGAAQLLFDAIEELKTKITRLEKLIDDVNDLKRLGLGENILYISYLRDGIPEKIVLHKKNQDETGGRFEFNTTISLSIPA